MHVSSKNYVLCKAIYLCLICCKENPQAESFDLTSEQKEKLDNAEILAQLRKDFIDNGRLTYDSSHSSLLMVINHAKNRKAAIDIIENHLGHLTSVTKDNTHGS